MKHTSEFEDSLAPLTTDADILRRVHDLIGRANLAQLWLLFLDHEDVQLPLLIPINGLPLYPDDGAAGIFANVADMMPGVGADSLVIVWERRGAPKMTDRDAAWLRYLAAACASAGVRLRAVLLSHSEGVRWVPPDDYA